MIAFLLANWRAAVIGLAIAGAVGYVLTIRLERDRARMELAAAQQEIATLGDRIKAQNAAVEKLKADGDARVKAATDGLARTLRESQVARSEAARLRTLSQGAPTQPEPPRPAGCPPSGADRAVAAIRQGL